MKVLVLGGNRYIGLHLFFELARQGHAVTVFNSHIAPMPPGTRRLHGDRKQPGVIEQVLTPVRDEFDAVFDNTSFTPADMQPIVDMFRGRVKHFVFTSSIAVYLQSDAQPIAEDFPVSADESQGLFGSYGADKVRCEQILAREHAENGLPYSVVRVSHSCGPMSPLPTREPGTFTRLEQGRPLLLAGDVGANIHVVHIQDVARLMCAILGNERAIGQIYNAAGSQFCTITAYMRLMAKAVGVEPNIVKMPSGIGIKSPVVHWLEARHGGMAFSIEKARRDLGWEPGFTLASALADSYRWFVNEGRARYTIDFSDDDAILAEMARRGESVTA